MDFLTKFELFKNYIRKWPHRRYRSLINKLSFCGNAIFKIKNSYKKRLFIHILWDLFSKLPKYTYELKMTYVMAPVQSVCVLQSTRHMWRRVLSSNHLKFKFSIDNLIYYNFTNNFSNNVETFETEDDSSSHRLGEER